MRWFIHLALWILVACSLATPLRVQKTPDVRLDVGSAPGAFYSRQVEMASSGSAVFAVWLDKRNVAANSGTGDIYFNRSLDAGATWLPADLRLNVAATGTAEGPQIAASGAAVYVTWSDFRNGGGADIYFNRSSDAGTTWLPTEVRLDVGTAPGGSPSRFPRIAASGGSVFVVWEDGRRFLGFSDIFLNRSMDGGLTWLTADVRLNTVTPLGGPRSLQVAASGPFVYVTWLALTSVYFNRSLDSGTTWLPSEIQLAGGQPRTATLAARSRVVHVTWSDSQNGSEDVLFNRSLDAGTSWLPTEVRLDVGTPTGSSSSRFPQIATSASGSFVYVVWQDDRNGLSDIYFNRSLYAGQTWLAQDVRLDLGTTSGTALAERPVIASWGPSVSVAWRDERWRTTSTSGSDIYLNRSLDAGQTWLPSDIRLNSGSPAHYAYAPRIAASDSSVYVSWHDFRNGNADVYFNLASGYQPYGAGTPGSGAILPTLRGSGDAGIGGTISLDFTGGLGGASGLLASGLGSASQVARPLLAGTLLVAPAATIFFQLTGPIGVPGMGSQSILLPVPNDPRLLGTNANFQGLFLDNGAPQGVSMSNAIATWIG